MTVRFVGGGGERSCVLRMAGPQPGINPVSSPLDCVFGGAFIAGGGLLFAGGKLTRRLCPVTDDRNAMAIAAESVRGIFISFVNLIQDNA